MDFQTAARLGGFLAKDYAERMFELLVKYQNISASEAASRLSLHIRTAQDFLEGLTSLGVLAKEEVYEKKRPYFRYSLHTVKIEFSLDLATFAPGDDKQELERRIRERKNSGVRFSTARSGGAISSFTTWTGTGRDRHEHRINLTESQGRFLFHLPFPVANVMSISQIMEQAEVDREFAAEILDIVLVLEEFGVIESA